MSHGCHRPVSQCYVTLQLTIRATASAGGLRWRREERRADLSHSMWCLVITRLLTPGAQFLKNFMTNLLKTYEKVWLTKNLGWACDYQKILQKSHQKLRMNLCKTYEKLTTTLQVSYENVNFAARDVIPETLCQRLFIGRIFWAKNN